VTYRQSYLKTTLAAAFCAFGLLVGVMWLLATGKIGFSLLALNLKTHPWTFWTLTFGLSVLSLLCLAVAVGGLFSLYGDAQESKE